MRLATRKYIRRIPAITDGNGNILRGEEDLNLRWNEYFKTGMNVENEIEESDMVKLIRQKDPYRMSPEKR